jgi:hypothetical protein
VTRRLELVPSKGAPEKKKKKPNDVHVPAVAEACYYYCTLDVLILAGNVGITDPWTSPAIC